MGGQEGGGALQFESFGASSMKFLGDLRMYAGKVSSIKSPFQITLGKTYYDFFQFQFFLRFKALQLSIW